LVCLSEITTTYTLYMSVIFIIRAVLFTSVEYNNYHYRATVNAFCCLYYRIINIKNENHDTSQLFENRKVLLYLIDIGKL